MAKGIHPNSLANLKPTMIKKGEVRNPEGGRAHRPESRALRKVTNETVKEVIETGLTGTLDDLRKIAMDPNEAALKRGLAKAIGDAVAAGDVAILERLFERLTGKVPVILEHQGSSGPQIVIKLPGNGRESN